MRSRLAIPFMPVLQRDSAPRAGGEFVKRSCILDKNPGKSPAFHLPDRDCWAQGHVRAAETFLVLFMDGYVDRAFLPATQS